MIMLFNCLHFWVFFLYVNCFYLFQDSVLLVESCHFTFVYDDQECSLVVLNAQPEDSGVYTCTAKNLAGEVSCKAELIVHTGKNINWNKTVSICFINVYYT